MWLESHVPRIFQKVPKAQLFHRLISTGLLTDKFGSGLLKTMSSCSKGMYRYVQLPVWIRTQGHRTHGTLTAVQVTTAPEAVVPIHLGIHG